MHHQFSPRFFFSYDDLYLTLIRGILYGVFYQTVDNLLQWIQGYTNGRYRFQMAYDMNLAMGKEWFEARNPLLDVFIQNNLFWLDFLGAKKFINPFSYGFNESPFSNLLSKQRFQFVSALFKHLGQKMVGLVVPLTHDVFYLVLDFYNTAQVPFTPRQGGFPALFSKRAQPLF